MKTKHGRALVPALLILSALLLSACNQTTENPEQTLESGTGTQEQTTTPVEEETWIPLGVYPNDSEEYPKPNITVPNGNDAVSAGNIAKGKPVEVDYEQGEWKAVYITDGDSATRWSGHSAERDFEHWVILDLEKSYTLSVMMIHFEAMADSFRILVSETGEDGDWTEIHNETLAVTSFLPSPTYEIDLKGVSARYIKLQSYKTPEEQEIFTGQAYCSIYEIEVYAK